MLCNKNQCIRVKIVMKYFIENMKINKNYPPKEYRHYCKNLIKSIIFPIDNKNRNIVNSANKIIITSNLYDIFSDKKSK